MLTALDHAVARRQHREMGHHESEVAVDQVRRRLAGFATSLKLEDIVPAAVHAAKLRVIDTSGEAKAQPRLAPA